MRKSERDIEARQDDDARFFLQNPGRTYRLRPALRGEAEHPANNIMIAMFVAFDGKAAEVAYREARIEAALTDSEHLAGWLWQRCQSRAENGVSGIFEIPPAEIDAGKTRSDAFPLLGLGSGSAPAARIDAMVAFAAYRDQRRAG